MTFDMQPFVRLLALIAAFVPGSVHAQSFVDFPDTQIEYYTVTGDNARDVRRDIDRKRPAASDGSNARYDARATYNFRWRTRQQGSDCDVQLTLNTSVVFPRLASDADLNSRERKRWVAYAKALEEHETGHIQLAYAAFPEIETALANGPCQTASERVRPVMDFLAAKQREFDRMTDHGQKTGSSFP